MYEEVLVTNAPVMMCCGQPRRECRCVPHTDEHHHGTAQRGPKTNAEGQLVFDTVQEWVDWMNANFAPLFKGAQ